MRVPIDPRRTLQENARKCYARYKKAKRAVGTIEEQGGSRQISFLPHGETRVVPSFVPVEGAGSCENL